MLKVSASRDFVNKSEKINNRYEYLRKIRNNDKGAHNFNQENRNYSQNK